MTSKEILRCNKLIAIFMGGKLGKSSKIDNIFTEDGNTVFFRKLSYDNSWEWLTPVVEKIGSIAKIEIELNPNVSCLCVISSGQYYKQTFDHLLINAVFNAVVEFIEWYNNENKKE